MCVRVCACVLRPFVCEVSGVAGGPRTLWKALLGHSAVGGAGGAVGEGGEVVGRAAQDGHRCDVSGGAQGEGA